MESKASLKHLRVTPRKAMLIADLVRGKSVSEALSVLKFSKRKKTAGLFAGLIKSALANAVQNGQSNVDKLVIGKLEVGKGPTLKRFRPRAMGRAFSINKKTSHLFINLVEKR